MEVLMNGNGNAPFNHEIHEWNHTDEKTGALLRGRAEANRYVNGNFNSFGKSLSQSFETTDGIHHKQHKQMNILQTVTSTGLALQVVRAQTSTLSTSSRRAYQNCSKPKDPLTLSNKTNLLLNNPRLSNEKTAHTQSLVAEISNQMKKDFYSEHDSSVRPSTSTSVSAPDDRNLFETQRQQHVYDDHGLVKKCSVNMGSEQLRQHQINEMLFGDKTNKERFLRGKSASIEELANINDCDDDAYSYEWKRVSKIRRSLQIPTIETKRLYKFPADLPETHSVSVLKIKQNIENGYKHRQLQNCVLKGADKKTRENNHFVALNSILKESSSQLKCPSFVRNHETLTAESLQDIRRGLRKMSSPDSLPSNNSSTNDTKHSLEKNCKSLEFRKCREREIIADDWLSRRKSYGFEKMQQPSESFGGVIESVDSGLGLSRSSDLPSNWSPTITANEEPQRTIITFGNDKLNQATTLISLFNRGAKLPDDNSSPIRRGLIVKKNIDNDLNRHSIVAVNETVVEHYQKKEVDKKISLVSLNRQFEEKIDVDGKPKKVEFCKTEIHFAADSGKVNIVETNTKPPPTTNFRRRRRQSATEETISDSKHQLHIEDIVDINQSFQLSSENIGVKVTTSIGSVNTSAVSNIKDYDNDDDGHSEDGLRGILKNKPIKPKPYHLGMENSDILCKTKLKLKPVDSKHTNESALVRENIDSNKNFESIVKERNENYNQESTATSSTRAGLFNLAFTETSSLKAPSVKSVLSSKLDENLANELDTNETKDYHKISIDLKLPHPKSMDKIMDELKSTSLIIKTMKSSSYFGDAMKHLERENPFIRSSSLRLVNESLQKSNNVLKPSSHRYSSSLDGNRVILDGSNSTEKTSDANLKFFNEFLEENGKHKISVTNNADEKPVPAPRFKKKLNSNHKLNQQISELKSLYKNLNESDDDNEKADEEVMSYLDKNEEEKLTELSGSWSIVRVKKVANALQQQSSSMVLNRSNCSKTSMMTTATSFKESEVEAAPRTTLAKYGLTQEKSSYQQDNSEKLKKFQNFESNMPALSRSNSLPLKKEDDSIQRLATGTRQLKAHELTFFGIKTASTMKSNIDSNLSKTFKSHLSNELKNKTSPNYTPANLTSSYRYNQEPDLIMHHKQKYSPKSKNSELALCENKTLVETFDKRIDEKMNLEPFYENLKHQKSDNKHHYDRVSDVKRDEKILFELSRAADEIMETCQEMYKHDDREKKLKSQLDNIKNCLETINEGKQSTEPKLKVVKSKCIPDARNFEDSLRRYHHQQSIPQHRTSSQSSFESLTHSASKASSAPSSKICMQRGIVTINSCESKSSSGNNRIRESASVLKRFHRVCSREPTKNSQPSSSESDLPNSSTEEPRRLRRMKGKHHRSEENGRDEKKSSRIDMESKKKTHSPSTNKVSSGAKLHLSEKKSASSAFQDTTLSSPSTFALYVSATEHVSETLMIPPRRNYRRHNKVVHRKTSLRSKNNINTFKKTNQQLSLTRRIQLEKCICS